MTSHTTQHREESGICCPYEGVNPALYSLRVALASPPSIHPQSQTPLSLLLTLVENALSFPASNGESRVHSPFAETSPRKGSHTPAERERERVLRSSFSHHSHQCLLERGAENIAANSVSCLFQYKTYEETRRVLLYRGSYFKAFISLSCSVQWSMSYSISTGHGKERGQQCRRYLRVTR